ncbi:hypothetical protein PV646_20530 [Streptomyces sp. ID05-26A]|nr:hypothetical protein [Streptomyces sp. ID05-26A]
MNATETASPPSRRRLRSLMVASGRPVVVLATAAALFATVVQGAAEAAPRHSTPVKKDEIIAVNSQGSCRVSQHYTINASSAAEAANLAQVYRKLNGRPNGTGRPKLNTYVNYTGGTTLTVWGYSDVAGIPSGSCIEQKVAPHRGRALSSVPRWAQELMAAAAGVATALAVTTFTTAFLTSVSGGTATVAAAAIGGCVGGVAGHIVYQLWTPDRSATDLQAIQALVACLTGAATAAQLGTLLTKVQQWVVNTANVRIMAAAVGAWSYMVNARWGSGVSGTIQAARQRMRV